MYFSRKLFVVLLIDIINRFIVGLRIMSSYGFEVDIKNELSEVVNGEIVLMVPSQS